MLKKIVEKAPKTIIIAGGVFGIAWLVNRTLIEILQRKANYYDNESKTPDLHPATKRYYERQRDDFRTMADFFSGFDPIKLMIRKERDLSDYLGRNGHRQY